MRGGNGLTTLAVLATPLLVGAYLGAIVAADLLVAHVGPKALPVTAVVLIPFDLIARDVLQDAWRRSRWLWPKLAALVAAGSAIAFALNRAALPVAVASAASFAAAGLVDTLAYTWMWNRERALRMNVANVLASVVDSIAFPWIAFGAVSPALATTQALAKVLGGAAWTHLYLRLRGRVA